MPYTLSISPLLDDGGFYSAALPSLTGRIFSPPPPSGSTATPLDTATSSNLTLSFTSAGVPPAGSSAMILTEPAIGGDFLRSGLVNALPPSPAAATAITLPTAAMSSADIAAAATGFSVAAIAIPAAIRIVCGLLSAGTFIPLTATVGPATATTGTGSITITVPGSLTVLVLTTRIVAHDRAKESDITFYGLQGSQIDTERLDRGPRTPGLKLIWLQKRRCTVP